MSLRAIGRQLNLARGTVNRYAKADTVPKHSPHKPRPTMLDLYVGYLQKRWQEGERNASQLHREIAHQGFPGSCSWVSRYMHGLRLAAESVKVPVRIPSARFVTALVMRKERSLSASVFLTHLWQSLANQ